MKLIDSLLEAISRLEGDALIMHVGEKPYVVTTSASMYAYRGPLAWGHVELSSRVLTTDAVAGMLDQLLPADQRRALVEYGAIEYELPHKASSDRFTVVAARGGDDVWLELRRMPASPGTIGGDQNAFSAPEPVGPAFRPGDARSPVTEAAVTPVTQDEPPATSPFESISEEPVYEREGIAAPSEAAPEPKIPDTATPLVVVGAPVAATEPPLEPSVDVPMPVEMPAAGIPPMVEPFAMETPSDDETATFEIVEDEPQTTPTDAEVQELLLSASASAILIGATHDPVQPGDSSIERPEPTQVAATEQAAGIREPQRGRSVPQPEASVEPPLEQQPPSLVEEQQRHAVVLPMSRPTIVPESPAQSRTVSGTPLERILRIAAARGAATVYVVARSHPVIRVDGEISMLDSEPVLSASDIERLIEEFAAEPAETSQTEEWMTDVPEVGRVRCVTFHDERGPGVIFRMTPPKAISADQLGIPPEVQALCAQPDGLVLVTGARGSGKSTLLNAFVDLINRTRSDHIITIESQIGFVHESRRSFVSQRQVKGPDGIAAAVRSAFREDPDVLVIDDIRTPDVVVAMLEAAQDGRLVFGALTAASTIAALDRIIELFPSERRAPAQTSLAEGLRGVVAQMLLRRVRGGRIAAREILLNTPVVAGLILEGKTGQLPVALDSGRRHGMVPLADSFATLVREGTVHAAEAYRKTPDRAALLAALRADGVDTSFAERLA